MTTYKKKLSKKNTKKGGCGCSGQQSTHPSIFSGGSALGPASLTNYDPNYQSTYPLFDVNSDPLNASAIVDTRQLPNMVGGKRRRRKSTSKKTKKGSRKTYRKRKTMKGGADPLIQNYNNNLLTNSNTIMGSVTGANIVSGNTHDLEQPFVTPKFL
jgi:hypothetical protein